MRFRVPISKQGPMTYSESLGLAMRFISTLQLPSPTHSVALPHPLSSTHQEYSEILPGSQDCRTSCQSLFRIGTGAQCPTQTTQTSPPPMTAGKDQRFFTLNCIRQRIKSNSQGPSSQFQGSKGAVLWSRGQDRVNRARRLRGQALWWEHRVCLLRSLNPE